MQKIVIGGQKNNISILVKLELVTAYYIEAPWFHCFSFSSIRISTLALDIVSMIRDSTCGEFLLGNHKSCQILIDFPLPILHLHPLSKTSLLWKMLAIWEEMGIEDFIKQ